MQTKSQQRLALTMSQTLVMKHRLILTTTELLLLDNNIISRLPLGKTKNLKDLTREETQAMKEGILVKKGTNILTRQLIGFTKDKTGIKTG